MIGPRQTYADLLLAQRLYGGEIRRDVAAGTYTLVDAVMDGRKVSLGPVRAEAAA